MDDSEWGAQFMGGICGELAESAEGLFEAGEGAVEHRGERDEFSIEQLRFDAAVQLSCGDFAGRFGDHGERPHHACGDPVTADETDDEGEGSKDSDGDAEQMQFGEIFGEWSIDENQHGASSADHLHSGSGAANFEGWAGGGSRLTDECGGC